MPVRLARIIGEDDLNMRKALDQVDGILMKVVQDVNVELLNRAHVGVKTGLLFHGKGIENNFCGSEI